MNWQMKKIEEIAEFVQTGKTPPTKESMYFSDEVNWFNPADFGTEKYLIDSKRKVSNIAIENNKVPLFPEDTILITCIGDIGKVGICKQPSSSNQQITGIRVKEFIDNSFFYYWVKANKAHFEKMSNKAVVPIINNGIIKQFNFKYPPLPEQKSIAQILDKADALRQKNKQLLAAYDELLQATFLDMFGDPVSNPKGWEKKNIGSIATARLGKMLDKKQITGEYLKPYLRNTNVKWFEFQLDELLEMDFNNKDQKEFQLRFGDVLMCEGGEIGRCAIWKEELTDCFFQKALHRIRFDQNIMIPEYFVRMFYEFTKNGGLNRFMGAATISHLTGVNLKKLEILTPPINLQNQFAQIVENIEAQKAKLKQSMQESEALFNALVQKAFKGEL